MSGRQQRADNLRELSLDELKAAERAEPDFDDEYIRSLEAIRAAETLERELSEARRELAAERKARREAQLTALIFEDIIGTGTSATAHPSEGLDIVVASDLTQLIANIRAQINESCFTQGPIAFLPVRIWPLAIQPTEDGKESFGIRGNPYLSLTDRNTGQPLRNLELGRSRFQGSYSVVQVSVDGHVQDVSISGMARISINPFGGLDPDALCARLDRTARWDRWSGHSSSEIVNTPDGPAEDDEGPPFIPSQAGDDPRTRPTQGGTERGRAIDPGSPHNQVEDIEQRPSVPTRDTDDL